MVSERDIIRQRVARLVGGRPVRWADQQTSLGDFDEREWTLELFDIQREERRPLQEQLWELRKQVWEQMRQSLILVFHTPEETNRRYAWVRREEPRLLDTALPEQVRLSLSAANNPQRMDRRIIPAKLPRSKAA